MLLGCSSNNKSIKVKGSDTEVNLAVQLAENFYKVNSDFSIAISGGGSGLGIASLLNGQADVANSSRPLNEEEINLFKTRKIELRTIVFAEDATAFIVQKNFPLDSIDVKGLRNILSGKYKTWKKVTGQDVPVNIYGRQSNSGTHSFVKKKLAIEFSRDAKEMNGNAQIMEGVKMDVSGIGYVGAGYILQDGTEQPVKVLKITEKMGLPAISPLDKEAINAGLYYFQRPLYQFIPTTSWGKVEAFIAFEKGALGQKIIRDSGYYIIN
ncbi:Phosphate ABC transporter, periplasmic phosphate-binding protein PstS [Arcticibacter svalbardensis MN12-7]|uniref:Phosphate ABC transporter, periplasmic phosphate-binding protein PstS n=1 Tax=Arcticibacter svalbardensis MN12-7 TaxID=1150600 RepID=R9GYH2_9SPHI|nr:Phosphate ABC transporter, periplasmic phosphate-binding protein PstS [Arcticibacter svalbardensis MN12-7]